MSLIRTNLFRLTTRPVTGPVTLTVVRPVAVVLSGRPLSSANPKAKKQRDEELYNDNYSDEFDESDSLEKGKAESGRRKSRWAEKALSQSRPRNAHPVFGPLFDDFMGRDPFAPLFSRRHMMDPFDHFMPVRRNRPFEDSPGFELVRSSPSLEIKELDNEYEIQVDIPEGLTAADVSLEVYDGYLHLTGKRRVDEDGRVSETRFERLFSVGDNVNVDEIKANLSDGTLVVKAPKVEVETGKNKITIPITETPVLPDEEEVKQKAFGDEFDESDWAETGKKQSH